MVQEACARGWRNKDWTSRFGRQHIGKLHNRNSQDAAFVGQLWHLQRAPEMVEVTVPQTTSLAPMLDAAQVKVAITQVERVWDQLFPAE